MKKKFKKTTSCLYMLMLFLETNKFDKEYLTVNLEITELDFYRYKSEIINMFYDFDYYDLIEKIDN